MLSRNRWLLLLALGATWGCSSTLGVEVQEEVGDDDDYIEDVDQSDDPGLDDAYEFIGSYSLSESIQPLRQLDYPGVRMYGGHRCTRTLSVAGCAIASHAMLMDYYGYPTTLPDHNSALHTGSPHGHTGCALVWQGGLAPGVEYVGVGPRSLSSIKRELDDGSPVIAHVRDHGRSRCHHFVLVTGYSNNGTHLADFEIIDPVTGSRRNLSAYQAVCSTRVFDGPAPVLDEPGDAY